jgi:hypothetical protein
MTRYEYLVKRFFAVHHKIIEYNPTIGALSLYAIAEAYSETSDNLDEFEEVIITLENFFLNKEKQNDR